ncbi:MAG: COG4223 family protein [Paracoccaceae bacterium]
MKTDSDTTELRETIGEAQDEIRSLKEETGALQAELAKLSEVPEIPDVTALVAPLEERLAELESRPVQTNSGPVDTSALIEMQEQAVQQQAELERLLEAARETETAAQNAATLSQARAALAQINNALGTGDPFADAITALQSSGAADIPSELTSLADDGVATLSEIQGGVEEAARAGLAAARDASRGDEGLGGFLQRQLGARSLSPKEGDDPDAVLSRIEPAVRSGDLEQALNEAEALPESAKSAMADWLDMLRTRHAAVTAADALTQRLNTN